MRYDEKAFAFLDQKGVKYDFHDYKKAGIDADTIREWLKKLSIEQVVNTKGTTWKQLTDEQKSCINNPEAAIGLMIEKPSLIKRPIVDADGQNLIGFNPLHWEDKF